MSIDINNTQQIETELTKQIVDLIVSVPSSNERCIAALAATANVLAILSIRMVGEDKAPGVMSDMVNRAIETRKSIKEEEDNGP